MPPASGQATLGSRRRRRCRLAAVAAVSVLGAAAFAVFGGPGPEELEARWRRQSGFGPRVVHPARDANATARQIEERAAPLGLTLAPYFSTMRPRPTPEDEERFDDVRDELAVHLRGLRVPAPTLHAPPPALAAFLADDGPVPGTLGHYSLLLARHLVPNFLDFVPRTTGHELDVELTGHLLEARELLAARGRAGLSTLPPRRPSRVRGFPWVYELRPNGLTIHAVGELPARPDHALPMEAQLGFGSPAPS